MMSFFWHRKWKISGSYLGLSALILLASTLAGNAADPVYNVFNQNPDLNLTSDGKWKVNDEARPQPPKADPKPEAELAKDALAPAGAIQLFDADFSKWIVPQIWNWRNGVVEVIPNNNFLRTKDSYGSCHIHAEWMAPEKSDRTGQNRGNSGIFLMGKYEVQVLDTYDNKTYSDGMAGALYGVKPPDFNSLRPSGQWQYYDIWFRRPTFDAAGAMLTPATVTIYINGVLVQNNSTYDGPSSHHTRQVYQKHEDKRPLELQYHNENLKYRNIWIVPLDDDKVISPAGPVGVTKP